MTSVAVLYSGGGDESSELLFSFMAVQPTPARKVVLDTFVKTLKGAGIWQKLDLLYVLAAHDAQAARLNWIDPARFALTVTNSPTFTANQGYAGDGTAAQLVAASYNPTAGANKVTQNSATFGIYIRAAASYDGSTTRLDLHTGPARMGRQNSNSGAYTYRINDASTLPVTVAGQTGHLAARRTASNERSLWRDGASLGSNSQASSANSSQFNIFGTTSLFSDAQIAAAYAGASLDDTQMAAMNTAIDALKTGIGF